MEILDLDKLRIVSIPQAVRAVATRGRYLLCRISDGTVSIPQAVRAVATSSFSPAGILKWSFNTASGTRCCNSRVCKSSIYAVPKASFGKPQTVNGKFSPH